MTEHPALNLLEERGETGQRSPRLMLTYNGALEAGLVSLEAHSAVITAQYGRPRAWTRGDLDAAPRSEHLLGRWVERPEVTEESMEGASGPLLEPA